MIFCGLKKIFFAESMWNSLQVLHRMFLISNISRSICFWENVCAANRIKHSISSSGFYRSQLMPLYIYVDEMRHSHQYANSTCITLWKNPMEFPRSIFWFWVSLVGVTHFEGISSCILPRYLTPGRLMGLLRQSVTKYDVKNWFIRMHCKQNLHTLKRLFKLQTCLV